MNIADHMNREMDRMLMDSVYGGTCTNVASREPLTFSKLQNSIRECERLLNTATDPMPTMEFGFGQKIGIRFYETEHACQYERRKVFPKRPGMSQSHYRKCDREFAKRYGMKAVPVAYMFNKDAVTGFGGGMMLHPQHAAMIRDFR